MLDQEISKEEMLEAISRSGYLLESEIASMLSKEGYFTETNGIIIDTSTGKSRELDLIAEYHEYSQKYNDLHATSCIKYVFEIKNNNQPLVLLTKYESSPYTDPFTYFKEAHTTPAEIKEPMGRYFSYYDELFGEQNHNFFTQYCSFQRKKTGKENELMACHPEMLHSGLLKICQYCEDQAEFWEDREKDKFYRKFLFLPVVILNDDLYELELDLKDNVSMKSTDVSRLVFNYHFKEMPRSSVVYVVTKKALQRFLEEMLALQRNIENRMYTTIIENK